MKVLGYDEHPPIAALPEPKSTGNTPKKPSLNRSREDSILITPPPHMKTPTQTKIHQTLRTMGLKNCLKATKDYLLDSSDDEDDLPTKSTVEVGEDSDEETNRAKKGFDAEQVQLKGWREGMVVFKGFEDEDIDSEEGDNNNTDEEVEMSYCQAPLLSQLARLEVGKSQ